jgi:hypothetical protein
MRIFNLAPLTGIFLYFDVYLFIREMADKNRQIIAVNFIGPGGRAAFSGGGGGRHFDESYSIAGSITTQSIAFKYVMVSEQ